ncbi:hypothetical protein PPL_12639 [Heterostelium album PN500]|uniref:Uncharacterized protein n=1 Tax=Heterostelium pallidum (strain ATCC 26659 / Pp 5 / PN500) TaxID=670386 RepID=D3BN61_HETP5|nr:hypothetical protein PPL_12639 [Heterostelium album PN500]EFA77423.1 hypothetical protein PPL_12639 [Heterostelium album PN500]|eukprot:XP_020429552.1 hypothetical protein PPL_12639 [Heterostelium album PN500]
MGNVNSKEQRQKYHFVEMVENENGQMVEGKVHYLTLEQAKKMFFVSSS